MPIPSYATPIEENNIPSYATPVEDNSAPSSIGSNILSAINAAGGTVGRGLLYGASDIVNPPLMAADYINKKIAGLLGANPNAIPSPALMNPQSVPMPGVSVQAQQALDPLARAGSAAAELALPVIDTAKLAATLGKSALETLQKKLGIAATQKANSFISDLLQGNNFSNSHLPVLNELRQNYDAAQTESNSQYQNILNQATQKGYTGGKNFSGISVDTGEKSIAPDNFTNQLSQVDLDNQPKDIQKLLNPFTQSVNNNLSFNDAHNLQSELGKQGAKLQTSADGTQRYLGGQLLGLRDTLKNDITNSLAANGDDDLANQYQNASNFFKTNVAPYRENSTIRKVVMGSGLKEINPANIGNVLKKDDGAILPIANDLSEQSKNLLLANQLKSATQQLPNKVGALVRKTNPNDLISAYGNLDNKGLAYLRTPQSQAKIASIMGDLARQNKFSWAAGIAIPAAIGAEGARHLF